MAISSLSVAIIFSFPNQLVSTNFHRYTSLLSSGSRTFDTAKHFHLVKTNIVHKYAQQRFTSHYSLDVLAVVISPETVGVHEHAHDRMPRPASQKVGQRDARRIFRFNHVENLILRLRR